MDDKIYESSNTAGLTWRWNDGHTEVEIGWPREAHFLVLGVRALANYAQPGALRIVGHLEEAWHVDGTEADARRQATAFLTAKEPANA